MKEKEKKMEKKKKKWLSLFLAVILAFTGLPVSLMAAGNAKSQTQETTKDPAEPDIGRGQLFFLRIIQRKELDVQ